MHSGRQVTIETQDYQTTLSRLFERQAAYIRVTHGACSIINCILSLAMATNGYAPGLPHGALPAARHWAVAMMKLHEDDADAAAQDLRTLLGAGTLTHLKQFCLKWYGRWNLGDLHLRDAHRTGRPRLSYSMSDEAIAHELKVWIHEDGERRPCFSVAEVRNLNERSHAVAII